MFALKFKSDTKFVMIGGVKRRNVKTQRVKELKKYILSSMHFNNHHLIQPRSFEFKYQPCFYHWKNKVWQGIK